MQISSWKPRRFRLGFFLTLAGLLAFAAPAFAAPPANDNFANAVALPSGLPQQISGTNVEATTEAEEPEPTFTTGGASVWYRWTAPGNVMATADTCTETTFDTALVIYTGAALNGLTEVGGNDDACGDGLQSRTSFEATAGTTYYIAVEGFSGDTGLFQLHLAGAVHAFDISSSLGAGDPEQAGRLNRNGAVSTCETPNVAPLFDSEMHRYKSFPIVSLIHESSCLALISDAPKACEEGNSHVQAEIYKGSFNPLEITAGLLTAAGTSPPPSTSFGAELGAGETATAVVNEVSPSGAGTGCAGFTLKAYSNRPWAATSPKVLSNDTDAAGKAVVAGIALAAGPATWGSAVQDAFQWQACDAVGNACTNIAGATSSSFTPRFAQVGHTLRMIEAATAVVATTSTTTTAATGVVQPSNAVRFGKFQRNAAKGIGSLTVLVPGAGKLTLTGKGVKKSKGSSKDEGKVKLKVRARGKAKATLFSTGKARVKVEVKFVPTGGAAGTASRKLTLKKTTK